MKLGFYPTHLAKWYKKNNEYAIDCVYYQTNLRTVYIYPNQVQNMML